MLVVIPVRSRLLAGAWVETQWRPCDAWWFPASVCNTCPALSPSRCALPPFWSPSLFFSFFSRYGLVNKNNAAAIIEKCVLGTEGMKANWRGNMANPGTKAEPVSKPAPATKVASTPEQEAKPAPIDEALGKVQRENGSGDGA